MTRRTDRSAFDSDRLDLFWNFVAERQAIWHRRFRENRPPPWTEDPTLASTRFTNIYRELDPGTQYAIARILEQDFPAADRIFNIMFYRLIGRSETHAEVGFQTLKEYDPTSLALKMKAIRDRGEPVFTAAYMVSGYTQMGTRDKVDNVVRLFARVRAEMGEVMARIGTAKAPSDVYSTVRGRNGFGNFLAYQVVVDLLYPLEIHGGRPLLPFSHDDWAAAGPGAQVGVRLIEPRREYDDLTIMRWLRENQRPEFERLDINFPYLTDRHNREIEISLANIQNCLCEFHKYVKIREGTGRGRRKYQATAAYAAQRRLGEFANGATNDQPRSGLR